ncbi:hypothetical protein HK098_008236 [Nowakowskiella sp. JEL0407]|nr:hypothetical protein HK098_008236 [Nowakowskiella sp. JEL0407]
MSIPHNLNVSDVSKFSEPRDNTSISLYDSPVQNSPVSASSDFRKRSFDEFEDLFGTASQKVTPIRRKSSLSSDGSHGTTMFGLFEPLNDDQSHAPQPARKRSLCSELTDAFSNLKTETAERSPAIADGNKVENSTLLDESLLFPQNDSVPKKLFSPFPDTLDRNYRNQPNERSRTPSANSSKSNGSSRSSRRDEINFDDTDEFEGSETENIQRRHSIAVFNSSTSNLSNAAVNKKRSRATPEQLQILESTFAVTPTPSGSIRREIAAQCNMTERSVQIWFQNRRARARLYQKRQEQTAVVHEKMNTMISNANPVGVVTTRDLPHVITKGLAPPVEITSVKFSTSSLSIGSWRRTCSTNRMDEDLHCTADLIQKVFVWMIVDAGVGFRLTIPFSCVHRIELLHQNQNSELYVDILIPPTFSMEAEIPEQVTGQLVKQWVQCGDFTEDSQGSLVMRHALSGDFVALQAELLATVRNENGLRAKTVIHPKAPGSGGLVKETRKSLPNIASPFESLTPFPILPPNNPDALSDLRFDVKVPQPGLPTSATTWDSPQEPLLYQSTPTLPIDPQLDFSGLVQSLVSLDQNEQTLGELNQNSVTENHHSAVENNNFQHLAFNPLLSDMLPQLHDLNALPPDFVHQINFDFNLTASANVYNTNPIFSSAPGMLTQLAKPPATSLNLDTGTLTQLDLSTIDSNGGTAESQAQALNSTAVSPTKMTLLGW